MTRHFPRDEYNAWSNMRQRCYNERHETYSFYGGRGIAVCDRWNENFKAFFADMGRRPGKEFTLDRIDTNGPYAPGNCRWITMREQAVNRRGVKFYELWGMSKTMAQWAREFEVPAWLVSYRIKRDGVDLGLRSLCRDWVDACNS